MAAEDRRVGAIIVHYEAPDDLRRCVSALQRGDRAPDRIVIVDNSETATARAGGADVACELGVERIESATNVGFGAACNRGAEALLDTAAVDVAAIDTLFLVNQDAEPATGALDRLVAAIDDQPDRGAVSPLIVTTDRRVWFAGGTFHPGLARLTRPGFGRPTGHVIPASTPASTGDGRSETDWLNGCALLVRTDAWRSTGGFDERFFLYWEDVDLSLRLVEAGWTVRVELSAEVVHHRADGTDGLRTLTPRSVEHAIRSRLLFVRHRQRRRHQLTSGPYTLVNAARLLSLAVQHRRRSSGPYLRAVAVGLWRGLSE
ncbi:MAG: glycosyltransferase family 2 protein [Actinomycetota bacterium]